MNLPGLYRLSVALGIICVLLLVGSGFLFWTYGVLKVQTMFADEQTRIFDDMRTRALKSTAPEEIASCLGNAMGYYPSGTKQRAGSRLDHVVERHRAAVVRDIVEHLRRVTGQDIGESPEAWVRKFGKTQAEATGK